VAAYAYQRGVSLVEAYPGYDAPAADPTRFSTALAALLPDL
jgi:hypothetical protein